MQVISLGIALEGLQAEFEKQGDASEPETLSNPILGVPPPHSAEPDPVSAPPGDAQEDSGQPSSDEEPAGSPEGSHDEEIEQMHDVGRYAALQQGTPLGNDDQEIVVPLAEAPSSEAPLGVAAGGGLLEGLGITDSVDMEMHEHVRQEMALVLGNMVLGSRLSSSVHHRSSPPSSTNEQPVVQLDQSVSAALLPSMQPLRPTSLPRQTGRPSSQTVRSRPVQRSQTTSASEPTLAVMQRRPASKASSSKVVRSASPASSRCSTRW